MIWEKGVGSNARGQYAFRSSYSISYRLKDAFAPGVEAYYRPADNAYQLGPVFQGELHSDTGSEIEYRVGILFGVNPGAPNQTLLFNLAYEFF